MTVVRETKTAAVIEAQQGQFKRFLVVLIAFWGLLPLLFWSVGTFSLRSYFILAFIWFLITSEVFAPAEPETVWWQRLRWIKAAGWLVLLYIIAERVTAVA